MATQVFPQVTVPVPLETTQGNIPLAASTTTISLSCGCTLFTNPNVTLTLGIQISNDGGTTWLDGPRTVQSPPIKNKDGTTSTDIRWIATLDPANFNNPNRRIRGHIVTSATDNTTQITLGPGSITET